MWKKQRWHGVLVAAVVVLTLFSALTAPEVSATLPEAPSVPPQVLSQPDSPAAIIVDNADPGFSITAGEWGTCQDGDCQGTCFGADFRYAEPGCTDCRAQFSLQAAAAGDYDVWTWWPWGEDRATDTPFAIQYSGGALSAVVDQRNSGDAWWWLATITLAAGERVTITVSGSATGYANADAVALTPAGTGPPSAQGPVAAPEAGPRETGQPAKAPVIQYFYSETAPNEGCYYLHWDVAEATAVYLDGQPVDSPGSTEVCPEATMDYALTAENAAGSVDEVVTVVPGGAASAELSPTPAAGPTPLEEQGTAAVVPGTVVAPAAGGAIIIDHTCTDLSKIPGQWIEAAKKLTLHYAHTSHGEQIVAGVSRLQEIDARYGVAIQVADPVGLPAEQGALRIYDGNNYPGDNYITPEMYWSEPDGQEHTRSVAHSGLFSLSMWSWCGQQSENSAADVQRYLATLSQFEAEFPDVRFIYLTGHSDGTTGETLARNNQAVRDYVRANGKVLFDFEDIETHDPAGNYYPNNGEGECTWCDAWCNAHPSDCTNLPGWCPHSETSEAQKFNCKLKANAFWWMMARLAGWDGVAP